jgi:phosphoglucomutase/phosphomannomutase
MADPLIQARILDWCAPSFPLEIRDEAAKIYQRYLAGDRSEDVFAYMDELKFGTGGLRGVLGNGPNRMNAWTVGKSTSGFARYLKKKFSSPSAVIAHDSRRMSSEFARITAGIFAGQGIKVYLFDGVTPTPILSYAVRKLKASGGVVITASHNPPEYNGYKVYLSDGSQFTGEEQAALEKEIESIHDWNIPFLGPDDPLYQKNVTVIRDQIKNSYYEEFQKVVWAKKVSRPLTVVYSPLHGTGGPYLPGLLEKYGVKVIPVPEQIEPDGEFPTVAFPNPEEPEALDLCRQTALKYKADLFVATDPDADRMGAGIRNADGDYTLINGNQTGSILCAFLCENYAKPGAQVFKTIVTTELQRRIAEAHNVAVRDVLTGFKYIAEQMRWLENNEAGFDASKDYYLFGGEESYGYLPVDFVRDKDSLASTLLLCMVADRKGNLLDYLDEIYLKYGLYLEDLKSVTMKGLDGLERMNRTIDDLRSSDMKGMKLGNRTIVSVLDYKRQTVDGKPDAERFACLPVSNVLQFILEPEGVLTIRPSGTEPKVKLYASLKHPLQPQSIEELRFLRRELKNELSTVSGLFLAKTGLTG